MHEEQTDSETILEALSSGPAGLVFKREDPSDGTLQFLDLRLAIHPGGICWEFRQRTEEASSAFR